MEWIRELLLCHAAQAHWYIFAAIILAGFSLPISADLLILLTAFLAGSIIPEHFWPLLCSIWLGCYLSAWCAYGMGRFLGEHLLRYAFFRRLLPFQRVVKIKNFYERYGLWTLVVGRFIPFGVRNGIFMTTGLSRISFWRFLWMDALACSFWVLSVFTGFYLLSHHYEAIWAHMGVINLVLFAVFGVTVIAFLWYKKRCDDKASPDRAKR